MRILAAVIGGIFLMMVAYGVIADIVADRKNRREEKRRLVRRINE